MESKENPKEMSDSAIPVLLEVKEFVQGNLEEIRKLRQNVQIKADGTAVTDADFFLESRIENILRSHFESIDFVSEESFETSSQNDSAWTAVLDPIDGTENFASGLPVWGVSLSIWSRINHKGSLLMVPELGETLMTGDSVKKHQSRIIGLSSKIADELKKELRPDSETRIFGCAVYNFMQVISGRLSKYINPVGAASWDILAGIQLALEHGCEVKIEDEVYFGKYLEPNRKYRFKVSK